jgi:hypothetical protein
VNGVGSEAVCIVSTQGAGQCVVRVGCAHDVTVTLYGVFGFQNLYHDRARGHELHQTVEERTTFVLSVEAFGLFASQTQHFRCDDFETRALETSIDSADVIVSYSVWFNDGKGTFYGHDGLYYVFQNRPGDKVRCRPFKWRRLYVRC